MSNGMGVDEEIREETKSQICIPRNCRIQLLSSNARQGRHWGEYNARADLVYRVQLIIFWLDWLSAGSIKMKFIRIMQYFDVD